MEETPGRASLEKLGCRTPPQLHAGGVGRQQQQPIIFVMQFVTSFVYHMRVSLISGVIYQIKRVELADGQVVHCLWVSRDPEEQGEGGRSSTNITLASSFNSSIDASRYSLKNNVCERSYRV